MGAAASVGSLPGLAGPDLKGKFRGEGYPGAGPRRNEWIARSSTEPGVDCCQPNG